MANKNEPESCPHCKQIFIPGTVDRESHLVYCWKCGAELCRYVAKKDPQMTIQRQSPAYICEECRKG
jgi:hypothetical protein